LLHGSQWRRPLAQHCSALRPLPPVPEPTHRPPLGGQAQCQPLRIEAQAGVSQENKHVVQGTLGLPCSAMQTGSCLAKGLINGPTLDIMAVSEPFWEYHWPTRQLWERNQPWNRTPSSSSGGKATHVQALEPKRQRPSMASSAPSIPHESSSPAWQDPADPVTTWLQNLTPSCSPTLELPLPAAALKTWSTSGTRRRAASGTWPHRRASSKNSNSGADLKGG
jgi:hypothetical protein